MLLIADGSTDITQAAMSGVVQIVLALVGGYFTLRVAQVDAKQSPPGERDNAPGRQEAERHPSAQMDSERFHLKRPLWQKLIHGSVAILVLFLIGAILLGVRSFMTAMQAADLSVKSGAAAVQLNKVTIKATKRNEGWLQHRLWIEADPEILDSIDHVKYVFDDPEWPPYPSPIDGNVRNDNFAITFETRTAVLDYITVVIMYKDYRQNGKMQAFAFRWKEECQELE